MEWNRLRPLPRARACLGVAVTEQGLFAIGGEDKGGATDAAELFDSRSREWRELPKLPVPLTRAGVAAYRGAIVVLGGLTPRGPSNLVWILRPGATSWTALPRLPAARWDFPAVSGKNGIYLVGGAQGDLQHPVPTAHIDKYSLSGEIVSLGSLPSPRSAAAASLWRGKLVSTGGIGLDGKALRSFDLYDLKNSSWTQVCPLNHPRRHMSLVVWNGGVLAAGGASDSDLGRIGYSFYDAVKGCVIMVDPVTDSHGAGYIGPDRQDPGATMYPQRPVRTHDLAIVIGIRRYETLPAVPYADADAEAVGEQFRMLGFSTAAVKVLVDSDATFTDITAALEGWLPRVVRPDSQVYIYFSGHGAPSVGEGTAYLVPRDGDPEYLKSTAIPLDKLVAGLGALNITHAYVILDSCFSGSGSRSVIAKGLRPLVAIKKTRVSDKVSILAAAMGSQAAGSSESHRHGLFTFYFLAGINGAGDANADGRVTLRELHEYLFQKVKNEARSENREQTPVLDTSSPDREF